MTTVVAVDGSALGNPGPTGWAWYVDENCWAAGGWPSSSNNRGELTALLELLKATAPTNEELHVLADSQYVINSVTKWIAGWKANGWRKADKKPVVNVDLMQAIDKAITGRKVSFEWVRGHSGHPLNEAADDKARAVSPSTPLLRPQRRRPARLRGRSLLVKLLASQIKKSMRRLVLVRQVR